MTDERWQALVDSAAGGRPMNGWIVVAPSADWKSPTGAARAHVEAQT